MGGTRHHFIKGDGLTVGGIRINDLCIVLPHDPCVAPPPSKPTPQPTVEPTPEPTPEPEEPKPSDGSMYEDHDDIVVESLPAETPNAEPTNAPPPRVTHLQLLQHLRRRPPGTQTQAPHEAHQLQARHQRQQHRHQPDAGINNDTNGDSTGWWKLLSSMKG